MALDILDEVKDYLAISSTDTSKDDFITQLISNVQAEMEDYCNQPIEQVGVNVPIRQFIVGASKDLQLDYFNIPITILEITYTIPFESGTTTVSSDDYEYLDWYGIPVIKFKNSLVSGAAYTISAGVGFPAASIPAIILSVATEMTAWKYQESVVGKALLGKAGDSYGGPDGGSISESFKDLTARWQKYLNNYKRNIF